MRAKQPVQAKGAPEKDESGDRERRFHGRRHSRLSDGAVIERVPREGSRHRDQHGRD